MQKIHLSILGGCPTRDMFGFCDLKQVFVVDRYVEGVNPISLIQKSPLKKPFCLENLNEEQKRDVFGTLSPFYQRCLSIDIRKDLDYVLNAKSDYLLLDFIALRFNVLRDLLNEEVFLTDLDWIEKSCGYLKYLTKAGYISSQFDSLDILSLPDAFFESAMDRLLKKILSRYDEEQIILVDLQCVEWCIDKDKRFCYLGDVTRARVKTQRIRRGFEYFEKRLPRCHIIFFPQDVVSYDGHKWGKLNLHYVDEYYEYGYRSVETIVNNRNNRDKEEQELNWLYQRYSVLFTLKYGRYRGRFLPALASEANHIAFEDADDFNSRIIAPPQRTVMTYHGGYLYIDEYRKKLIHGVNNKYAITLAFDIDKRGVFLFVKRLGKYIFDVDQNGYVKLVDLPRRFEVIRNNDMSFSIFRDGKYLSARMDGTVSWMDKNQEWEHFYVEELIRGYDVFYGGIGSVCHENRILNIETFHGTKVIYDGDRLSHHASDNGKILVLAKIARPNAGVLFVLKDEKIFYIEHMDNDGIVVLSMYPFIWEIEMNEDGSISFHQKERYISAELDGSFSLKENNFEWEHFYLKDHMDI